MRCDRTRSPRDTPERCSAWPTRRAGSRPAVESSPTTSRCARPRHWSPWAAPTPSRPRVRKDAAHAHDARPPHLLDLEQRLNQHLGTTVLIRAKNQDRGQIIIDYHSREEFDRLAVPVSRSRCDRRPVHDRVDRMRGLNGASSLPVSHPCSEQENVGSRFARSQSAANRILDLFLLLCS